MRRRNSISDEASGALETLPREEIDRLILYSETRIKYWVVAGVAANLLALAGIGIPFVYYLGTAQVQSATSLVELQKVSDSISTLEKRIVKREMWETSAEGWMVQQGFTPPREKGE